MDVKFVIVGVLLLVVIIGGFIFMNSGVLYSSSEETEECERIVYNGNPVEQINVVFLAKGIGKGKINDYIDSLLSFEVFSKSKDQFNFFYVEEEVECEMQYSAILCYSKDLIKKSASCPNDFVVVLKDEKRSVRSSAYMNVISLNSNLPVSVFAHEFAHVFANLADEYVPAKIPRGAENCQKSCEDFSVGEGCFEGCSESDFFRSSESSIMRTLSSNSFYELNENIIKEELESY
jgi:hypothetical protein